MTTKSAVRIVYVGEIGNIQQQIVAALSAEPEFDLIDLVTSKERMARDIRAADPKMIIVDHLMEGEPTIEVVDELATQFPDIPIIGILGSSDPTAAQQVTLAGARAFLIQPFTQINLLSTMRRVQDLEKRRERLHSASSAPLEESSRPLRVITVFSPRGGVGTTSVATNLALALYGETGKRVLLFEGKLFFGHMDVMLNLRAQSTLADLLPHARNLDVDLIEDVVLSHASGVHVLKGPSNVEVAQGIRPDDLYQVFVGVQRNYDFVVVDAGSALNENSVTLMDAADRIVLVTTPDLAALHDVSNFIRIGRTLSYAQEKMIIVLNRAGMDGGVRPTDIETAFRQNIYTQIPDDAPNALRSVNSGMPILIRYPRSKVSQAITELAKNLLQVTITEVSAVASAPTVDQAQRDVLLASSRLG